MANINLNNLFRKTTDKKSPVDSNIILNKTQTAQVIYSDLKLDLDFGEITERPLNADENNRDAELIFNKDSVMNAVKNILNTRYCSRLLDPDVCISFDSYLFEELTESKAYLIAYELQNKINTLEPRVKLEKVSIEVEYETDTYYITLAITIPSLREQIALKAKLDKTGIEFSA